jgi:tRNA-splicing ligase RtcB (3'-phosphate/5'-hydroxy nucleic acid ligase)
MKATLPGATVPIYLWADPAGVEAQARAQLENIAALPWVVHHVAVMPDVHYGKGATVGSVIAMRNAVSPAAVGVDLGCGMAAMRLGLRAEDLPDSLAPMRSAIEAAVPVGFSMHDAPVADGGSDELWAEYDGLAEPASGLLDRAMRQMGTLGGGNHFIEVCLDDQGTSAGGGVWLMLHSGSRRIGLSLAEHHMAIAKRLTHNAELPDPELAVFLAGTPEMDAYRRDLFWAQRYAARNREVMLGLVHGAVQATLGRPVPVEQTIRCHHNYVADEVHFGEPVMVTRKGAIRAGWGEWGIIPGSMGTRSYIVRGLGNPDSYESASHGAGRAMSRNQARKRFSVADLEAQTAGVESRKDAAVVDEIPAAYKPIDEVIAAQSDLVEVKAKLKQVLCVKG